METVLKLLEVWDTNGSASKHSRIFYIEGLFCLFSKWSAVF